MYKPGTVMSIHGILSKGVWQESLTNVLHENGINSLEYKYGVKYTPFFIEREVNKFKEWYFNQCRSPINGINLEKPFHRPSIVAHSLGTFIICKAMEKYSEIKFDKIFLHGSIVPKSYDWYQVFINDQANTVICEMAHRDWIIAFGWIITHKFKSSGKNGFNQESTMIKYENVRKFGHSDFQYAEHFKSVITRHLYSIPRQIKIIHGEELNRVKAKNYFKHTLKIDKTIYADQQDSISFNHALSWFDVEPDIWSFLLDSFSGNVIGYYNMMPLKKETLDSFLQGTLKESNIPANAIAPYSNESFEGILIMSVCLERSLEEKSGTLGRSSYGEILLMAMIVKLTKYLQRVKNKEIKLIAVAWTPVGKNLCEKLGLKKSESTFENKPIYSTTIADLRSSANEKRVSSLAKWLVKNI